MITTFGNLNPGMFFRFPYYNDLYMKINVLEYNEEDKKSEMMRLSNEMADAIINCDQERVKRLTLYSIAVMDNDGKIAVAYTFESPTELTYLRIDDRQEIIPIPVVEDYIRGLID